MRQRAALRWASLGNNEDNRKQRLLLLNRWPWRQLTPPQAGCILATTQDAGGGKVSTKNAINMAKRFNDQTRISPKAKTRKRNHAIVRMRIFAIWWTIGKAA
jgi:hypothetical protein